MSSNTKRNNLEEKLYKRLRDEEIFAENGAFLLDLKIEKQDGVKILTLFCDIKGGGIGFDELEKISPVCEKIIDDEYPEINHDYFEVSSPGIDKTVASDLELEIYGSKALNFKLYAPEEDLPKEFSAAIKKFDKDKIVIVYAGKEHNIERKKIALIKRLAD